MHSKLLMGCVVILLLGCTSQNPFNDHDEARFEDQPESFAADYDEMSTEGIFGQNLKLARTINFGNMLDAPNEGDWGLSLKAEYFVKAKEAGFSAIRLPISWTHHAATDAPYRINPSFFQRVDWALRQAQAQQLNIILDFHHYDEIHQNPLAEEARFLALWKQIAQRYRGQPDSVFFELLNEPHGAFSENPELWNDLLLKAIQVIRQSNPSRPIIIGPVAFNSIDYLEALSLPNDPNLIATVHFYDPFAFTHQGAEWIEPRPVTGIGWSGSKKILAWDDWSWDTALNWRPNSRGFERLELSFKAAWAGVYLHTEEPISGFDRLYFTANAARNLAIWCADNPAKQLQTQAGWHEYEVDMSDCGSISDLFIQNNTDQAQAPFLMSRLEFRKGDKRYSLLISQKTAIARKLSLAKAWVRENQVPLFLGEFGVYHLADLESRVNWTKTLREEAQRRGFSWAYWELASGFGIYDDQTKTWNQDLLKALIP